MASHLLVSTRAIRAALKRLQGIGSIRHAGWTRGGVVVWELTPWAIDQSKKSAPAGKERIDTRPNGASKEDPGAMPGTTSPRMGDAMNRQLDKEETRMPDQSSVERAALERLLLEDPAWLWHSPDRERLTVKALDQLREQGHEPMKIRALIANAVLLRSEDPGELVLDWIEGGVVAERLAPLSGTPSAS